MKSSKGNLLGGGPRRDGAFGGKKQIRHMPWQPGDSVGCNFGSNNPGIRRGDKPVAPGFRKVR